VSLRFKRALFCAAVFVVPGAFGIDTAMAQSAPGALPSREQIELPKVDSVKPKSGITVTDETKRVANCPFADSPIEVAVDRLHFTAPDGSALPAGLLDTLADIKPQTGKQKLAQLCDLRDAAASALSNAGYIAGVTIPPQEINAGDATLIVIPARLVDVHVSGSAGRFGRTLAARVDRLKALPALNTHEIESILLGMNDVPGLQVKMALRAAGTGPGQVVGEVAVEYTPFTILANVTNTGSRSIGRESGTLRAEYYGLTGLSDRTFVGASSTADFHEQQVLQVGHYFATDTGLSIGGRFSYAWSKPDIGALDLRSRSLIGGFDVSAPLLRSVRANADIGGGVEIIEQRIQLFVGKSGIPVTLDKLRVGYLRLSASKRAPRFNKPDAWGISGSLELRQGFDILGATKTGVITPAGYGPSRFEGSASATVLRGGLNGFVSIGRDFSLSATAQGQWASGPLLSFEEFSVGNLTIGRGYDPGVTSGDKAIGIRLEPRWQLPVKSRAAFVAFGFYDTVHIWNDDTFTTEGSRALTSFGGGMRAILPGLMSLEAMYAHPQDPELNLPGAPRASDRVLLSLTIQFAPRR